VKNELLAPPVRDQTGRAAVPEPRQPHRDAVGYFFFRDAVFFRPAVFREAVFFRPPRAAGFRGALRLGAFLFGAFFFGAFFFLGAFIGAAGNSPVQSALSASG
jgi:hypothetical protein